jgi:hypothetical protein
MMCRYIVPRRRTPTPTGLRPSWRAVRNGSALKQSALRIAPASWFMRSNRRLTPSATRRQSARNEHRIASAYRGLAAMGNAYGCTFRGTRQFLVLCGRNVTDLIPTVRRLRSSGNWHSLPVSCTRAAPTSTVLPLRLTTRSPLWMTDRRSPFIQWRGCA